MIELQPLLDKISQEVNVDFNEETQEYATSWETAFNTVLSNHIKQIYLAGRLNAVHNSETFSNPDEWFKYYLDDLKTI